MVWLTQNPQGHQDNAAEANPPQADHPDGGLAPEGQPPPGPAPVIAAADEAIPLAPAQAAPPVHAIPLPPGVLPFKLVPFSGTQAEDATEFLADFCEYAKAYSLTNDQSKHLFMMSLKDRAKQWIRQRFNGEFDTTPCEEILDAFKEKFYPRGINWAVELEYESLKQIPGQTVQQYASQVEKLGTKLGKNDMTVMQTFVCGLLPTYKRAVLSRGPTTFNEAQQIASLIQNAEIVTSSDPKPDGTTFVIKELIDKIQQITTNNSSTQTTDHRDETNNNRAQG